MARNRTDRIPIMRAILRLAVILVEIANCNTASQLRGLPVLYHQGLRRCLLFVAVSNLSLGGCSRV